MFLSHIPLLTTRKEEFPCKTPPLSMMMKEFPSANGPWDPKQADGNASAQLTQFPQVSTCPLPPGHRPMVTSLLDQSKVIIWKWKEDIQT
ncbi:hypothetical protein O181_036478 [Austropuccinia psidii MF-1]|uniref:Uncharacterized protein n=1 Tax=Austropuccinia psidii MF-1 TaxID=1389203 RepID=A0A9Q3H987_9BASI|nr:hypothetical protein [Austropuccinia psidii MF-1]